MSDSRPISRRTAATLIAMVPGGMLALSNANYPSDLVSPALADSQGTDSDEEIIEWVLDAFARVSSVPRESKHEKAISDYLMKWAQDCGCTVRQSEELNLFIDVAPSEGYENLPLTSLQAHMDMVCSARDGVDFDPLTDCVQIIVDREAGTVHADGTTLGADDGIGVAIAMATIEGAMVHGPLRVIFTVDEESGMTGAFSVTPADLEGIEYLINIDSEDSNTVTISSAAGATIISTADASVVPAAHQTALSISLFGLLGGHSGIAIGDGRCNAIQAMGRILSGLGAVVDYELVSFAGGTADNAIAGRAEAVIQVSPQDEQAVRDFISGRIEELRETYGEVEPTIKLSVTNVDSSPEVLDHAQIEDALTYITGSINGVYTMSPDIEGLVESSENLGQVKIGIDGVEIRQTARSSSREMMDEIETHQIRLAEECNLDVEIDEFAKAWPVDPNSVLVPMIQDIYRELNGEEIRLEALHAGLECGVFSELSPELDIASIGPDISGAHTPDETLYLDSIPKTWRLIERLLVSL